LTGDPEDEAGHPDFVTLEIPDDKTQIVVDQSRDLIAFLQLTSHGGRGRVVIIYPAEAMNRSTANALLKTLEEPPAGTVIILITESPRRLPPTILSRCQRIRLAPPDPADVVDWLAAEAGGKDLTNMLDFVGGAPLAALELHKADFAATANSYADDLRKLEAREVSPTVVAARWAKEPDLALQWLYWRLFRRVRQGLEALSSNVSGSETAHLATRASFRQMSQIRELRQLIKGGINAELNLVGLLMDWYGGLGQN
jgi:DNA polymerase-3 subunit delta'